MISAVKNIVHKTVSGSKPHVLNFMYDGMYDSSLGYTDAHISMVIDRAIFSPAVVDAGKSNISITTLQNAIRGDRPVDCIMVHSRGRQYIDAVPIANSLHVPIIVVDHLGLEREDEYPEGVETQISVGSSQILKELWKTQHCIYPTSPPTLAPKDKTIDVLIIGRFQPEEHQVIRNVLKGVDNHVIIGDNPGLSSSFTNETEYWHLISSSKILVNLSNRLDIPMSLVHSLQAGTVVISNSTPILEELPITMCQDIDEINKQVKKTLKEYKESMVQESVSMSHKIFNFDSFVSQWNTIFNQVRRETFVL